MQPPDVPSNFMKVQASQKCKQRRKAWKVVVVVDFYRSLKTAQEGLGQQQQQGLHYFKLHSCRLDAHERERHRKMYIKSLFIHCCDHSIIWSMYNDVHYNSRAGGHQIKRRNSLAASLLQPRILCMASSSQYAGPNHPRINLSFRGHCLSYDENLDDGLSTLHTKQTIIPENFLCQ